MGDTAVGVGSGAKRGADMQPGYIEDKEAILKRLRRIEGSCVDCSGWSSTSSLSELLPSST
jgi:hypothetical protein